MESGGLDLEIFPDVYEPAEDSFLLAKYAAKLKGRILDVGCGSGIQSLVCAKADPENTVLGVDRNPSAVKNARLNAKKNGIKNAVFMESDLFSKVQGKFDAIVFNPPYLPTDGGEKLKGNLNLAFDGGKSGRETTDRFLSAFSGHLEAGGTLLMVESSLAGIEKTVSKLEKLGFKTKILGEEKFFFEKIVVLEAKRASENM